MDIVHRKMARNSMWTYTWRVGGNTWRVGGRLSDWRCFWRSKWTDQYSIG